MLFGFFINNTSLTPLWLLSVGVALGVVVLGLVYGVLWLVSRRLAQGLAATILEGPLLPIAYLAILLSILSLLGPLTVPYRSLLSSAMRIPAVGPHDEDVEIPAATQSFSIPLPFQRQNELQSFDLSCDRPLTVITRVEKRGEGPQGMVRLKGSGSKPFHWERQNLLEKPFETEISDWLATNTNAQPVKLHVHTVTDIEYPEVRIIPLTALSMLGLVAFYLLLRVLMPKVSAIALTTAKESTSQPLFYVSMALGAFALLAFIFLPYNTFGEDVKVLKDSGLTLIMVLAIIIAVWSASVSVADEIEGRTALTLLSKPVKRWQFMLGKFFGVLGPVVLIFVMLGTLFLITVSLKVMYDVRESAQVEPGWQKCYLEMVQILPGLVLAFLETVVFASISVAISTRLPMMANLIVCASVYVLGHLTPLIVKSSVGKFEIVRFVGQFIATVLPVLDHLNIQAAVAAGADVPGDYLLWALAYSLLYCTIAMLLGLALFEDRDLA